MDSLRLWTPDFIRDNELLCLLVIVGVLVLWLLWRVRHRPIRYISRESLFTNNELRFYTGLIKVLPKEMVIFTKVRLADVITPEKHPDRGIWQSAFNRIASKHLDFVISNADGKILAVIELDDPSHNRSDRRERDTFVDQSLGFARIPILHIKTSQHYKWRDIREAIDHLVS